MWYVASLGYTPRVVHDVELVAGITDVLVLHGDATAEQVKANAAVVRYSTKQGLRGVFVEVKEPWNFKASYEAMSAAIHEHVGYSDAVMGASGATEVMNSALSLFASLRGIQVRFVDRKAGKTCSVDFELLSKFRQATGIKRSLLDNLSTQREPVKMRSAAHGITASASAVSQAYKELEDAGLVAVSRGAQDKREKLVALHHQLWFSRFR